MRLRVVHRPTNSTMPRAASTVMLAAAIVQLCVALALVQLAPRGTAMVPFSDDGAKLPAARFGKALDHALTNLTIFDDRIVFEGRVIWPSRDAHTIGDAVRTTLEDVRERYSGCRLGIPQQEWDFWTDPLTSVSISAAPNVPYRIIREASRGAALAGFGHLNLLTYQSSRLPAVHAAPSQLGWGMPPRL